MVSGEATVYETEFKSSTTPGLSAEAEKVTVVPGAAKRSLFSRAKLNVAAAAVLLSSVVKKSV
jgi:hypothetical protein